jgi:phosphoribosylformimino-5-aminoimidazole carboxamide ribotide isomerase
MLIPAIDLQGGRVVQLVQGEELAIASTDIDGWVERFAAFPQVQLIDLDAAKGEGDNAALVESICRRLPVRVGGGVRSIDRARALLARGARKVILGSSLFRGDDIDMPFVESLAAALPPEQLIAAVDARGGRVVIHGWRTALEVAPEAAVRRLEPFFGEFLFTNVDREGLMRGIDRGAIQRVRDATHRRLTAAGGVTTQEEIDWLDSIGVDAVAGMAVYTGWLSIEPRT